MGGEPSPGKVLNDPSAEEEEEGKGEADYSTAPDEILQGRLSHLHLLALLNGSPSCHSRATSTRLIYRPLT